MHKARRFQEVFCVVICYDMFFVKKYLYYVRETFFSETYCDKLTKKETREKKKNIQDGFVLRAFDHFEMISK